MKQNENKHKVEHDKEKYWNEEEEQFDLWSWLIVCPFHPRLRSPIVIIMSSHSFEN